MDYKEKYEMALEGIQEILGSGEDSIKMSRLQLRLQGIFPELSESEDERIRKGIIQYLEQSQFGEEHYQIDDDIVRNYIAWLEKQGEQKSIKVPKFKAGDTIRHKKQGFTCKIIAVDTEAEEYKLSECNGTHIPFYFQDAYELVEQKPAWSEEDETTKNNISHIIRQYDKISKKENKPCWYIGDCLLWMQNIKERVQPKQEWSEEDKNTLKVVTDVFGQYGVHLLNYPAFVHWLKTLPERISFNPYWKPSEEQMNGLKEAIEFLGCTKTRREQLQSLYEQLKKLRKE